jgi:glyoxylase-like metal-dependent hydrolase (beta-lactamase superfamily II)/ferredoxin
MASLARRLPENCEGDFFVDASCIDCDTCNWLAPGTFDASGAHSRVYRQPENDRENLRAEQALIACPVGAIGTVQKHDMRRAMTSFPARLDRQVYHCGFHAEGSFGAASYLMVRRGGNVLIDSPRFSRQLARGIAALGGVRTMFLTHGDDVADHRRWHAEFGCERVLHSGDIGRTTREIERPVEGEAPVELGSGLLAIPVPGHTRGSVCLLADERYLFSGDHVAWSPERGQVYAFHDACWYDWQRQIRSMERLAQYGFEWILPGHGWRCRFPREQMRVELDRCIAWMKRRAS